MKVRIIETPFPTFHFICDFIRAANKWQNRLDLLVTVTILAAPTNDGQHAMKGG